jgi:enterochelin esterase-like enzyme
MLISAGAGAGAVVAAGTGSAALGILGRRRHTAATPTGNPQSQSPLHRATERSGTLASTNMKRTVGWTISTPAATPEAVVYCLHGYGNNHRFAFDDIHLPAVVASLDAPLVVAAVDGGADSYWHVRADKTDAMAMLLDEFIPMIEQTTKTTRRALIGWSMGGYGSLLAAEQAPERFSAVAVASPALWTSAGQTAHGAFDGPDDYHRFDVFAHEEHLAGLTVRIDCGTRDPFYQATRRFVAALPPGHQGSFGPGSHDAAYWRLVAPAQITTIVQALRAPSPAPSNAPSPAP